MSGDFDADPGAPLLCTLSGWQLWSQGSYYWSPSVSVRLGGSRQPDAEPRLGLYLWAWRWGLEGLRGKALELRQNPFAEMLLVPQDLPRFSYIYQPQGSCSSRTLPSVCPAL